ncbi:MAG: alpha-N-arabinofuranosidase, partial [Clostridia bacterium]|nr:alpha-N-arabinofuranosidase [Clostridia bacterium]
AIHLLEYCNHPSGTYYSDLRRQHGYEQPHNIKLWCLGNEMDGPWQIGHKPADEYGRLAWQAGKVMKMIDPELELVVCGSAGTALPTFGSWDATVVEETYDICDYLAMHTYFDNRNKTPDDTRAFLASGVVFERQIEDVIACCDYARAKLKKKKKINLSIDEWNVVYRPHGKNPPIDWTQASHHIEDVYCMEDVIVVGNALISMLKHADRVKIGCLAQLVNVIAPIMTSDNGMWLQTIYYPFAHCSEYGQGKSIKIIFDSGFYETKKYGEIPYLDGALVENEEKEELTLFVINRDLDDAHTLDIDLRQYEGYEVARHIVVNHDNLRATNTEEHPNEVTPRDNGISKLDGGKLEAVLEAHSWNVIVMKKHK